jgi:catechol O-methyltransferase
MIVIISLVFLLRLIAQSTEASTSSLLRYRQRLNTVIKNTLNLLPVIATTITLRPHISYAARISKSFPSKGEIYSQYPYQKPSDIIRFIDDYSEEGNSDSVLHAMDVFSTVYPMYKLSPAKAKILTDVVTSVQPTSILEIGTFFGYSAIHMARTMPQQCTLCCIEGNSENAAVAEYLIKRSFGSQNKVLNRIQILNSLSSKIFSDDKLTNQLFQGSNIMGTSFKSDKTSFDVVFLDHDKNCYLPDLLTIETKGLLNPTQCTVVADNVIFPGTPEYLRYVRADSNSNSNSNSSSSSSIDLSSDNVSTNSQSILWHSEVILVPFERIGFETEFKEKMDGMAISTRSTSSK